VFEGSSDRAHATQKDETLAKLKPAILTIWLDKVLIDLRLVGGKSFPILCSNRPAILC